MKITILKKLQSRQKLGKKKESNLPKNEYYKNTVYQGERNVL